MKLPPRKRKTSRGSLREICSKLGLRLTVGKGQNDDGSSGQIAAMPNNRILWHDDSFVHRPSDWKPDYKTMAPVTWHAEEGRRNPQETAITRDVE